MKKYIFLIALVLTATTVFSQKKEKVKGSKIVTIEQKKIENFSSLEVADNIELFLVKGKECGVEIEADDNLHDAIEIVVTGSTLRLSTLKSAFGYKKLSIRVTYTDDFKMITAKNESNISALAEMELDDITIKSYDYSKVFINAKTKNFTLIADDKSKSELNLKTEKTTISLSKNSETKALITSNELVFDMYQKSDASVEGTIKELKLRLDNNSKFAGKNLDALNAQITCEAYTNTAVSVRGIATIDASGKSEIQLYGDQKIEMKRFVDSAVLMKKPTK
ncbi:DUF2807 domain-containing protein [Flavobacterium sp. SUN052]|uniref:GIN domain-containing protein n=1 Tax=Flavobacterium sp. SUN052 TaxID=3002441 RepID=UPI00237E95B2|nr:DUF2807 domain-containing protein [Flavobacterium sp. SUN052]MEC4005941.1 DUF2807 domain-containing protein [Flavobacterium sp. SUN052]